MSQRPSLLDEGDFASIGTKKGQGGGGGGGDKSKIIKIAVLVGVLAIAGLVWAWPHLRPAPVVRDSKGNPIVHEETEEDRQEFERQQRQIQMDVESGKASIGGA
ncbi:MAG: hypothetical protein ACF8R7_01230 [Phycisphaerales bacterium JB039]